MSLIQTFLLAGGIASAAGSTIAMSIVGIRQERRSARLRKRIQVY